MFPDLDQIRTAAYYRWQRRGGVHGLDRNDWAAAEQELLFALNYEIVADYPLDGPERRIGAVGRRVCRFCEQAAPRTTFAGPVPAIPEYLGNTALYAEDECDECRLLFAEGIEADFEEFTRPFRWNAPNGRSPRVPPVPRPSMPVAAYKCLARMALAIMPAEDLEQFPTAIEWVLNPEHDFDLGPLGGLRGLLHFAAQSPHPPRAALARRLEDDAPFPSMLFFLGTSHLTFEIPVPFGTRDEDRDGEGLIVPTSALALGVGEGACIPLPVVALGARQGVAHGVG